MAMIAEAQTTGRERSLVRRARLAVVALAWLLAAGVAIQVFLVGLSVYDSASHWHEHAAFGRWLGLIPMPLILAALLARLPLRLIVTAAALLVLYGSQVLLATADDGYLAALHPVNALALFGLAVQLGAQTRDLPNRSHPS